MKIVLVSAVALIDVDSRVLIARRPEGKSMAGLWEFPGGKTGSEDETAYPDALREKILAETGVAAAVGERLCTIDHTYSHFKIRLHAFCCRALSGRARALASDEIVWVSSHDLDRHPMSTVGKKIVAVL